MRDYSNILYIDTAVDACCVGAMVDGARVFEEAEMMNRGQADAVLPMVRRMMDQARLGFDDLDVIVTSVGPGTFTGLRAGLSVAQSFALALDIPVYGVTSLQGLALSVRESDAAVVAVVESRRAEFYVQGFGDGLDLRLSEPSLMNGDDVALILREHDGCGVLVGNGVARLKDMYGLPEEFDVLNDVLFGCAEDVLQAFRGGELFFVSDIAPVYLREADVSVSKKTVRVLGRV